MRSKVSSSVVNVESTTQTVIVKRLPDSGERKAWLTPKLVIMESFPHLTERGNASQSVYAIGARGRVLCHNVSWPTPANPILPIPKHLEEELEDTFRGYESRGYTAMVCSMADIHSIEEFRKSPAVIIESLIESEKQSVVYKALNSAHAVDAKKAYWQAFFSRYEESEKVVSVSFDENGDPIITPKTKNTVTPDGFIVKPDGRVFQIVDGREIELVAKK